MSQTSRPRGPKLKLFGREWNLPRSRAARVGLGGLLIVCGILGFLPILGFWMVPLGLLVLSYEFPSVRRWRRRVTVWWAKRNGKRGNRTRVARP